MERLFQECIAIGQVVIMLTYQLVQAMSHAAQRHREMNTILIQAVKRHGQLPRAPYTWERRCNKAFWEITHFTTTLWLQHFRISKTTFQLLCNMIGPCVEPMESRRRPVPTQKRIAIALNKLATCAEYRVVAETFGVKKTTVHRGSS